MKEIKTFTIDSEQYSLIDDNARKVADTLSGDETVEGSVANKIAAAATDLKSNFQAGVDSIYNAIAAQGTTPADKSLSNICSGISDMSNNGYYTGYNKAFEPYNFLTGERTLEGNPNEVYATIIGSDVTDMSNMFKNNQSYMIPTCGINVTNMSFAYYRCHNLIGSPVCGNNVITMYGAYFYCPNLIGSPVCGPNVTNMFGAYQTCNNLTGSPVCGNNVIDMSYTYSYCPNIYGDIYMNYNQSTDRTKVNAIACFEYKNNQNRLNIHVPQGYAWDNWLYNEGMLTTWDTKLDWTTMENGYYNTAENIYVYNNVIL